MSSQSKVRDLHSEDQIQPVTSFRKSVDYHPNIWGDYFTANSSPCMEQKTEEWMKRRANELEENIRSLIHNTSNVVQTMYVVDSLQLLGISYHFEREIDEALDIVYNDNNVNEFDLQEVATRFRLLRQHGYKVPSDIFNKFKDEKGNFKSSLKDDPRGLLSLYNAAYHGTRDETILEEAISFSKTHLKSIESQLEQPLRKQVSFALDSPLWRRMRRLVTRHYISIYEEENAKNEDILELAKLDFNMLQSLHKKELKDVSMWWDNLGLDKHLTYARNRITECYFWALGIYFEPCHSLGRKITAQTLAFLTIMDDTYDVYGTLEECRQLTEAIEGWDLKLVDKVPEYLKDFYRILIRTYEEFEDSLPSGQKFGLFYIKEALKNSAKCFFEEATWCAEHYMPSLAEHMSLSLHSTSYPTLHCISVADMGKLATKEAFEWVTSYPLIIKASTVICRIMDDIVSCELEKQREHVVRTIDCYMNDYHADFDTACKKLSEMVEDAWKDVNEEWLSPTAMPKPLLEISVNYSRMIETLYKGIDGYTNSSTVTKERITMLLVDPAPL